MSRGYSLPALLLVLTFSGCGGGGAPQVVQTADLSASRLQFSVGTATYQPPNDQQPISGPILNVVETFRQPSGASALLSDAIMITGPASFSVTGQNGSNDGGAQNQMVNSLRGTSAFGEGLGSTTTSPVAQPATLLFGNTFNVGGPPAFPRTTDGNYPPGFSYTVDISTIGGVPQYFPNGFPLGTYTLQVTTPPGSGESHTWTAAAKLSTMTTLPPITAPQISFDGKGGGAVTLIVPARLTELFVGIGAGNEKCWPFATNSTSNVGVTGTTSVLSASGNFSFFIHAPKPGPLTIAVPDNLGPPTASGNAPTFCSSAQNSLAAPGPAAAATTTTVQIIGVDYPLYEMSYPQSQTQLPQIGGTVDPDGRSNSQSDVTISPTTTGTAP